MVTETDAIKRISDWFKKYGWIVYQDKKNNLDNLVFHVKGDSTKKLDLIVKKLFTIGIEIKSGEDSKDLGSNSKLIIYYENYNDKKTFYFDENGKKIDINFFVIGTYYSPEGHLRNFEELHIDSPNSTRLKYGVKFKCCPYIEYESTFLILRRGIWDVVDNNRYRCCNTGIGALLSNFLDYKNIECKPAIQIKIPRQTNNKRKWRQEWIRF